MAFFGVKAFFAFRFKTEQRSDFLVMYQAAQAIAGGRPPLEGWIYWDYFAYQTPFALYEALVLRVTGGSLIALLGVGAVAMAGTNLLVYLMARHLTGSAVAGLFCGFAYLAYPGPYLLANTLTNDHLSTFLLYLGVYLAVIALARLPSGRAWLLTGLAGIVLQLGNLSRPSGVVVCVALVVAAVLTPVTGQRRGLARRLGLSAIGCLLTLAVYATVGLAVDACVRGSGMNSNGIGNNLPEWKFVLGLTPPELLEQAKAEIEPYRHKDDPDQGRVSARAWLERDIRRLGESWQSVLRRQLEELWALNDSAWNAFWPELQSSSPYQLPDATRNTWAYVMVAGERGLFLPVVMLAVAGVARLRTGRVWSHLAAFLACLVVVYALVHLVIEVQPRYRYLVMPAIFALGAPAWASLPGAGKTP
jgi:hypothetical protein